MANRQFNRGVRTGGRSARVRAAILAATFDELLQGGYAGLSVEAVATRAGVNKTTVYRRWPTLDDLLVDALTEWSLEALPVPDTGSIEADLVTLGRELADVLNEGVGRQIVAIVLTAGLKSARLSEATRRYFDHQALRALPTVNQAIGRGELPATCDANALLTAFRAPLFYRMVTTGDPIDEALITHAVRVALNAARAGLLSK
ncbi:putative HTH-type transcriptional regulator [Mycolicibacterium vanbaalenii]|uniref:Putative HTH-type transcriptional regulator n=1 Tax=Mycolicibacterium vanbaalenii TaxID=110539 RepID=A0A5S9PN90_MYCVN|nr:TetR/AcrR family transcriptional regulator [Mycolicibacterium vanbaalenii]CAA0105535.1 putative HTH-type transcriptional regulator [Mycolicibacterium vanbaalenii]